MYNLRWVPTIVSCFNLFDIWWGHGWILCLQNSVRVFSFLFLLLFYEVFSISVKNKECGAGHHRNFTKLNEKKSGHPFAKKNADFLLFDILTGFFWRFYGKLELGKVKDVHPEVYMRQSIQEWTK